ncbi:hypothetical protein AAFF_G00403810 [Aldrovandia affinis]|uniref:Uncharacterized protein n=1 Tax=Aldrovandia affinis TaxID=143900 RepID=A0AAD7T7E8_9TELE|nr:hypothetical protein AAFF_G00403810 [Aldrovandia affinis]
MAASPNQWITELSNITLSLSALYTACQLFKVHRAPAVGFFLLASSAALCSLPLSCPALICIQDDLDWDYSTAHVLLAGSALLPGLRDWLSPETLVLMSRCLALSSLCCSLIVCLFTANGAGALGSVALSLPALIAPLPGAKAFTPLLAPGAAEGVLKCPLKGLMVIGCLSTKHGLDKYLVDLQGWN